MSDIKETLVVAPNSPLASVIQEDYAVQHERADPADILKATKAEKAAKNGGKDKGGNPNATPKKGVSAAPQKEAADKPAAGVGDSPAAEGVSEDTEQAEEPGDGKVSEVAGEGEPDDAATKEPEAAKDPKAEARERRLQKVLDETLEEQRKLTSERRRFQQEIQQKQHQIAQVEAQLRPYVKEVQEYLRLKEMAAVNPKGIIDHFKLNMKQAIEQDLNDGKPTTEQEIAYLRQRLEQRDQMELQRQQQEQLQRQQYEAQRQAHEQANLIASQKQFVQKEIEANKEQFPLLAASGRYGAVWAAMVRHMNEGNGLLPPLQAARYVEESLKERVQKDAELFGFIPKPPATETPEASAPPVAAKPAPTITNKVAAPTTTRVGRQPVPPKDQAIEAAVEYLRKRRK